MAMLSGIRDFFHLRGNFQDYRDELTSQIAPAVPLFCTLQWFTVRYNRVI